MADKKNLLLFFDRPTEPIFMGKGDVQKVFSVPKKFLTDRYSPIGPQLANRFGEDAQKISVTDIPLPDFREFQTLGRREPFSVFIPQHRKLAAKLTNIFLGVRNVDELQSCCAYVRDRINPFLFNYALSVAILHRPDTQGLNLPNILETFPEKYLDGAVFAQAREEASVVPAGSRMPIEIPLNYTASDLEDEQRIAYWREDMGLNIHHWHWHLVYPFEGRRDIVAKDRRGELFYYMHQQIIARYNVERFCAKLKRCERFTEWKQPMKEGYYPKLDSLVASRGWPHRVPNSYMRDVNRPSNQVKIDVDDMIRWRDRIYEAIHSGNVRSADGQTIVLNVVDGFDTGVDILGNIIEASILSPNGAFYGDMHNMGHVMIGYCHDPDHRFLENFAVMGDPAVDLRDPMFFRWHAFVDDLFDQYKATIPRYTVAQLDFPNITVPRVQVVTDGAPDNTFQTFWQKSDVDLSRGMDFVPRGPVLARITHLQHTPFTYRIQVNNASNQQVRGTVRIFLGPKFDERGTPMLFRDHRLFFIEMDKFVTTLRPGMNEINQRSLDSSLTIPFEQTFRNLDANRPTGGDALEQFNYCGCGWPQHMLVPKGTPEGYPMVLFVMVSNYADDMINQTIENGVCSTSASFCGIKDKLYPDRKNMDFPFDRIARNGVDTLEEFVTPNMALQDVTVRFTDRTVIRGQ